MSESESLNVILIVFLLFSGVLTFCLRSLSETRLAAMMSSSFYRFLREKLVIMSEEIDCFLRSLLVRLSKYTGGSQVTLSE